MMTIVMLATREGMFGLEQQEATAHRCTTGVNNWLKTSKEGKLPHHYTLPPESDRVEETHSASAVLTNQEESINVWESGQP